MLPAVIGLPVAQSRVGNDRLRDGTGRRGERRVGALGILGVFAKLGELAFGFALHPAHLARQTGDRFEQIDQRVGNRRGAVGRIDAQQGRGCDHGALTQAPPLRGRALRR